MDKRTRIEKAFDDCIEHLSGLDRRFSIEIGRGGEDRRSRIMRAEIVRGFQDSVGVTRQTVYNWMSGYCLPDFFKMMYTARLDKNAPDWLASLAEELANIVKGNNHG